MLLSQLCSILAAAGIQLDERQEKMLQRYIDLVLAWNKRTNLISRRDEGRIVENHLSESLAGVMFVKFSPHERIIDVGSGAGFPAIPICIVCPESYFVLIESKRMKSLFLKEAIAQMDLKNVEVIADRVEQVALKKDCHAKFDVAMSRAVASLYVVYNWVEKLIRPGGYYLAWKGGNIKSEIEQLIREMGELSIEIVPMNAQLVPPEKNKIFVRVNKKTLS